MLDGAERRCAGAAAVSADEDYVGVSLGNSGGDGADADFGNQLDGDSRLRVDVFQVVDELREIFDGVDVVMRRRRDQADAGSGVAQARDDFVDFVAVKRAGVDAIFDLVLVV